MLEHGLSYKKGGLNDNVYNEWAHLCRIALTNSRVVIKPTNFLLKQIESRDYQCKPHRCTKCTPHLILGDKAQSDILAHGFWNRGRATIFDVCICNTVSHSYGNRSPTKSLRAMPRRKQTSMWQHASNAIMASPHWSTL